MQLYLSGYGLTLDDLAHLRTWGSLTPGHPEHGHTAGVETTTGPLGQGVGNAVGMAMAARRERGLLDPDAAPGRVAVRPHDLGLLLRRRPAGGRQRRGVVPGRHAAAGQPRAGLRRQPASPSRTTPPIAFTEDVGARYEAYGWHVQRVDCGGRPTRGRRGAGRRVRGRQGRDRSARRSSRCARSSAGRPRTSRTPARRTAPRSAPTRSRPPRRSSASTRRRPSRSPDEVLAARPRRSSTAAARRTPRWQERFDAWAAGQPRRRRAARPAAAPARCPTAGRRRCRRSRPTRRASPPARPPARCSPRSPRCCPSCGAARPTWPRATTPP